MRHSRHPELSFNITTSEANPPSIAHTDTGSGEPVVMIHCSSATKSEWQSLCETLNADFRSIAIDQWGCGQREPWTGHGEFNLTSEAAPIIELIRNIGTPVHLVGHSYGGGVALSIACAQPDLIRSLTLIEPSCFHLLKGGDPDDQTLLQEVITVAEAVGEAVSSGNYWSGMGHFVDYWSGEGTWDAMPHKLQMTLCQTLDKVILDFRALFNEPTRPEDYATIACPTLILCGERARNPSRRIVQMLADVMPEAHVQEVAGAGHMSPLTHPDAVNDLIREHLFRIADQAESQEMAA
jgi:pimeloyl-ACP methyl ester carboxylesterase